MRTPSPHLLVVFATPLLAHQDLSHTAICGLGASLIPPGGPICLTDPRYLAGGHKNITAQPVSRRHTYNWTHSTPCIRGDDTDDPICVFTDTTFAEGRGMSFVTTAQRASYMATGPAFTNPDTVRGINRDLTGPAPTKYEMRALPGKGMGLIATSPIRRGELIMANTASLMIDYRAFTELSKAQYTALQSSAVSHLPAAHRALILSLSAHTTATAHLPQPALVDLITATNSFDIDPTPADGDPDPHNAFFALFPSIARMNHACRPNADYRYRPSSLSQDVVAVRDILPGEEITLSYIDPVQGRAARVARLQRNWGFACDCSLCTAGVERAAESDDRISQIGRLKEEMRDWDKGSRACPEMGELLVALYEMEGLDGGRYEAYTLAALEFNAVGEPWTAVKYARMAVEWGIPVVGAEDEDVREMRELAADPWGHWSWERRLRE